MGPEYSWLEGGSYYQGLVPGPVGPPADMGEVTDIISSAAASSVEQTRRMRRKSRPAHPINSQARKILTPIRKWNSAR